MEYNKEWTVIIKLSWKTEQKHTLYILRQFWKTCKIETEYALWNRICGTLIYKNSECGMLKNIIMKNIILEEY